MNILEKKALQAMERYSVDIVVANELATRRDQVTIFHKDGSKVSLKTPPNDK